MTDVSHGRSCESSAHVLTPALGCNITQNSHFRMPFCEVLSPFTLPKPCCSVASSFTLKTLLSCLATSLPPYSSKRCHLWALPMPVWITVLIVELVERPALLCVIESISLSFLFLTVPSHYSFFCTRFWLASLVSAFVMFTHVLVVLTCCSSLYPPCLRLNIRLLQHVSNVFKAWWFGLRNVSLICPSNLHALFIILDSLCLTLLSPATLCSLPAAIITLRIPEPLTSGRVCLPCCLSLLDIDLPSRWPQNTSSS